MKASTLFVLGLAIGGLVVFGIRAASLDTPTPAPHEGHPPKESPAAADPRAGHDAAGTREAMIHVTLGPNGAIAGLSMQMPDGATHPVKPGGHAALGSYPAHVEGRSGTFTAHLHPHSDTVLEVNVRDEAGATVISEKLTAGTSDPAEMPNSDAAPENATCPVMGNPVDPEIYVDYEGRRIGFCCPGCDSVFLGEPELYLKKVDAELAERKAGDSGSGDGDEHAAHDEPTSDDKPPENKICPVMGNPVDPEIYVDYEGRRIGFCCPGCDSVFLEEPEMYLKKVDAELAKRGDK